MYDTAPQHDLKGHLILYYWIRYIVLSNGHATVSVNKANYMYAIYWKVIYLLDGHELKVWHVLNFRHLAWASVNKCL